MEEAFLATPDTAALKSALIRAVDQRNDEPTVLKYWDKTGSAIDSDLRELWRHEMRQSERVRAFPHADEVIVEVTGSGETSDAFYLAMPGDLAPLEYVARFLRADHWLKSLHGPRQRLILWTNIRRMALALGAVHGQGLVHGRLDHRAVFTTGASTQADFRLGGFEFCLRIAEVDKAPLRLIAKSRPVGAVVFSFLDDWRALGLITADLLGLDPGRLDEEEPAFLTGRSSLELRAAEMDLVRALVRPERNRALDAPLVVSRVDTVVNELEAEARADNSRYVLALRLGETSKLSNALAIASNDAFDIDDVEAQTEFVQADIETGAELIRTTRGELFLVTETLVYGLQPFRQAGSDETWAIASTNAARLRREVQLGRRQTLEIPANRIEIVRFGAASRRLQELRSDALDWSAAFASDDRDDDPTVTVRRGLLLAQVAEALFRAAEIVPVEVLAAQRRQGDRTVVDLVPSDAEQRARLNEALRVDDPHRLMRRLFQQEQADFDADWQLSDFGGLGGTARASASVRFLRVVQKHNRWVYEFQVVEGAVPPAMQLHLRKVDDTGTEQVLKRRLRMLGVLATQAELATVLADPRARLRTYRDDVLEEDAHFQALDESKQEALRSIWSTGPNQLVVGPPGVGKTTLVTETVRRTLAADPAARLLLSAQAHQALDHLAAAVQKMLQKAGLSEEIILVRSKADTGADLSGAQTPERAKAYLAKLGGSPLARRAPLTIRRSLSEMKEAAAVTGDLRTKLSPAALRQRRSFESLVLESANVLFSTTNSGDLERLVEERAQFDWAIIEEAAKATGPELLAPQLLSMRRLLIGDHNQLPPFDTDRIGSFLADQTRVKQALDECDIVVGNIFRDFGLDELREAAEDDKVLSEICDAARRVLLLFESLVTQELERQKRSDQRRRRVATELLQQHRMHPVIATVISECFYDGKLETAPARANEVERDPPPFTITDPRLPSSPIVFVDLPYMQSEAGAAEQLPTYHNPAELKAVLEILAHFRPQPTADGKAPTLAVLSPYNEQVERLGRAIDDQLSGSLDNLSGFMTAANASAFQSTVDSFQGSEADLVIVSLVRNNDHVGRAALGILRDRRRMNVLLSRAKWQLVIVGSLEFLRVQGRRYRRHKEGGAPPFLATMIDVVDRLKDEYLPNGQTKKLSIVRWTDLVGKAQ
ncbi:AAA domain-containing protein [Microvirga sp. TS319]|uniref:AAA domain-containing protein n=1 Tax=Microvirga sp. TS319 TaxID=3241165 RepID=UPI003519ECC5